MWAQFHCTLPQPRHESIIDNNQVEPSHTQITLTNVVKRVYCVEWQSIRLTKIGHGMQVVGSGAEHTHALVVQEHIAFAGPWTNHS